MKTKLRNLENGKILDRTFTAGEKIDPINVERRPYTYLYKDDMGYNFMHTETYEQVSIPEEMVENADRRNVLLASSPLMWSLRSHIPSLP